MATAQRPPRTSDTALHIMGSVGSLLERQDFSPEELRAALGSARSSRQPDGLLRKGLSQRELLSYLHLAKKDSKATKRWPSGGSHRQDEDRHSNYSGLYYREHPRGGDFTKTSLPERGRFDKCRIRPSVFKPAAGTGKSFLSMQSLAAHKGQKLWKSNGSLHTLVCNPPLSPGPQASRARAQLLHALSLDEGGPDPGLSDSSSGGSGGPGPFSASVGHVNHLGGSLDRAARSPKEQALMSASEMGPLATLSCLPEPPPPYDFTYTAQLAQDSVALRQGQPGLGGLSELKGGLSGDDGLSPFAQELEDRQQLWLAELKRLYDEKLQEVAQKAERNERSLQLQLFIAQQEQRRLRKELSACRGLAKEAAHSPERTSPSLEEEAKWEAGQKTSEISLLKQQLREAQAELAQKLAEIFSLKTKLRSSRAQAEAKDSELARLRDTLCQQMAQDGPQDGPTPVELPAGGCETDDSKSQGLRGEVGGGGAERLWTELQRERQQGREQALLFEQERRTWQEEKNRVLRYQREIQVSYMEMYHRNQTLEQELRELRELRAPQAPWSPRLESSKI
ncbi:NEDD4-binding protein 3 [Monodelphis domestica]|uniref:NEDD4-binding protein 3 n=1 Tax=Monodelphis domestica TaxID=13616 RepID=UPI00005E8352|nr:NEDD4-binding protein 3 [Monodelphis domestica]XP_007474221.1 NEDD4-binding protein 3 [Monodelphis domestica]XP_056667679.1 NEDD4-binding protein 3 [Monodelphis domestica]XP_056667680.1 NEDD4-binding protein 3 [Monodelphis domestica]